MRQSEREIIAPSGLSRVLGVLGWGLPLNHRCTVCSLGSWFYGIWIVTYLLHHGHANHRPSSRRPWANLPLLVMSPWRAHDLRTPWCPHHRHTHRRCHDPRTSRGGLLLHRHAAPLGGYSGLLLLRRGTLQVCSPHRLNLRPRRYKYQITSYSFPLERCKYSVLILRPCRRGSLPLWVHPSFLSPILPITEGCRCTSVEAPVNALEDAGSKFV